MRRSQKGVFVSSLALLAASLFLAACGGGRGADSCDASIQCEGGNDNDVQACIAQINGSEAEAAAYDCSDAFDKFMDCVDKTGICKSQDYRVDCNDELDALGKCEKAASGRK